ncbi:MAG TPA: flagellar motor protein [Syntrophomonas sp.]|jgi:chemotaxis protein MotA|nr:flagellar motor protein [Syntrophomonas sp.]
MDLATLIGLLLAVASIFGAFLLEGGSAGMLLVITAFLIVFGGTIGATLISFPLEDFKRIPYFFKMIFSHKPVNYNGALEILVTCADKARREGVLSLENYFDDIDNPFMLHGLQMVVDGTAPELTRKMLESEIDSYEYSENIGAEIFMTAGGFAPTMGIIGTVMGMITVLSNLSQPDELAAAIAVAFLATLYGIASANLLWIPFGTKIKIKIQREILLMEMILEGITSIQDGENPRILRDKLTTFLSLEASPKAA